MLTAIKRRHDRDDEGFTLIELMVVLLIIAILLAIAIPTFLGARNTANARSTQENIRNALTAEQSYYTSNQGFSADDTVMHNLEPSLAWKADGSALTQAGAREVSAEVVAVPATATNTDGVVIQGWAKDGKCYAVYQSNSASADFTAYMIYAAGATGCAAQASNVPTAAPSTAENGVPVATPSSSTWYTAW